MSHPVPPDRADPDSGLRAGKVMVRLYERLRARAGNDGAAPAGIAPDARELAHIRAAARQFTIHAEQCLLALMTEEHGELVRHSADALSELVRTWVACGVNPEDVWIELDRRTRMGNLLLALNTAERQNTAPVLRRRPWKIRTTKLP
ncbi:hypothetical protein F1645_12545 [Novacetimonas hansenii]|uniref:Uncharacterized protein n=2 Tax=Novacetimonas hansenii TaxID=436 RepID=D5QB97_NOVHA|nr:hypothetical protein [Novacetimonas hansenii]EFG85583.1 hypothetical protein GXY_01941 [Novacetimonas hansenii ATCC 23769]PYD72112.1 hypothetical protein CFR74_11520 [Novacetimonas hansenii]RFP05563.1 hypothetical protein BGC30_09985 [Novacetimonas hansenii]WEQ57937.1 hypothetical protein LV563_08510 [Novacetimonas hansenii]GAN85048.1 phosphoribosyl ATP pyrophosphatase [Novacetimonas hansenii JCM 7643]